MRRSSQKTKKSKTCRRKRQESRSLNLFAWEELWRPLESKRFVASRPCKMCRGDGCRRHIKLYPTKFLVYPGIILGYHPGWFDDVLHLSHKVFMLNVHVVPHCFLTNCHLCAVLKRMPLRPYVHSNPANMFCALGQDG